jgi:hypothetical protein
LRGLEAPGGVAVMSALTGAGVVLLGLSLVSAVLVPRRERPVVLPRPSDGGSIDARRGALGHAAQALTEQARGVTSAKVRVRPGRRSGGRLSVRADRPSTATPPTVRAAVEERLEPLTGPFALRARVTSRPGARGSRVQ